LAYNTDALATITATLRMDRCVLVYWYSNRIVFLFIKN
jgi:hypothetical protein